MCVYVSVCVCMCQGPLYKVGRSPLATVTLIWQPEMCNGFFFVTGLSKILKVGYCNLDMAVNLATNSVSIERALCVSAKCV